MKKKLVAVLAVASILGCSGSKGVITATKTPTFKNLGAVDEFEAELKSNKPEPATGDVTGFVFDFEASGAIDDGFNDDESDTFDTASDFYFISGDQFGGDDYFPDRATGNENQAYLEGVESETNPDQLVMKATTDGGLKVVRKMFVKKTYDCGDGNATACGWARYLDCVSNPTNAAVSVRIGMDNDLGSDDDGINKGTASTTDDLDADYYFAMADDSDPSAGYIIGQEGVAKKPVLTQFDPENDEQFLFHFGTHEIAAGKRACFMHYVILGNIGSKIMKMTRALYAETPRDGITAGEDRDIRNFLPAVFSVVGEAKSVPADTSIVVANGDDSVTVMSASDGSFQAGLDCEEGDEITVTEEGKDKPIETVICE